MGLMTGNCLAEAYRRAVDLNPRDYRAWYGLGQTYELLHMPYYALFYFRWCVMGLSSPVRGHHPVISCEKLEEHVIRTHNSAWLR